MVEYLGTPEFVIVLTVDNLVIMVNFALNDVPPYPDHLCATGVVKKATCRDFVQRRLLHREGETGMGKCKSVGQVNERLDNR